MPWLLKRKQASEAGEHSNRSEAKPKACGWGARESRISWPTQAATGLPPKKSDRSQFVSTAYQKLSQESPK